MKREAVGRRGGGSDKSERRERTKREGEKRGEKKEKRK